MRVLVTGGAGLVGRSTIRALLAAGHEVRVLDAPAALRRLRGACRLRGARRLRGLRRPRGLRAAHGRQPDRHPALELRPGDICSIADVGDAVRGCGGVIHLAAMIPPAADADPVRAEYVNRGGTETVIRAMRVYAPDARLVFTSSVAVYGDRRAEPLITPDDPVRADGRDAYAVQKVAAEELVCSSGLSWVILRLSYIVSVDKLRMDPLMFRVPLDTPLEICSARDAGRALAHAITVPGCVGQVFLIGGGSRCRTRYGAYLDRMTAHLGLGSHLLPAHAFETEGFHCGFMDTARSEQTLSYQSDDLNSYYRDVAQRVRARRALFTVLPVLRGLVRMWLLRHSPRYRREVHASWARELIRVVSLLWRTLRHLASIRRLSPTSGHA